MAMCCGGGGGLSWFEEDTDKRVNDRRIQQATQAVAGSNSDKSSLIITSCPFCLTMIEDGLAATETTMTDKDIAELVVEAMGETGS
jgi:Fe-S oxidoreductase